MKRMSCLTLLVLLSSVVAVAPGCASQRDKAAGQAAAASGKKRATADRMESFYPRVLGSFYRTDITRYDATGENASVGYNYFEETGDTLIAFTAYVYPAANESLDDALKSATNDVKSERRGVKVLGTTPAKTQQAGQTYEGRKTTFQYEDKFGGRGEKQKLMSELYLFKKGDRFVKYRVTYPAAAAAQAQQRLAGFLSAFPWPSGI